VPSMGFVPAPCVIGTQRLIQHRNGLIQTDEVQLWK
jgi:hypothetical protein